MEIANVNEAIQQVLDQERSRVLAALIAYLRDFELAEDALQDAVLVALARWQTDSVPNSPAAWLMTTARHKAIDKLRRDKRIVGHDDELAKISVAPNHDTESETDINTNAFPDDRLKLIFVCCHPALSSDAQIALTLRTLGGLNTEEIAQAFLLPVPTLAQRLVRAQRKIRDAGIPYEVPQARALGERTAAVLATLYLIFNEGYKASFGASLVRNDLCAEAIRLTRLLLQLIENEPSHAALQLFKPETTGLLALMLLHDARHAARTSADGELILLDAQDRSQWKHAQIAEGVALLESSLRLGQIGPYQIQAAISAVHSEAASSAETDWQQIAALYAELEKYLPTPIVQLNRAVAVAFADGALAGLMLLDQLKLESALGAYHFFHAARADLLRRLGLRDEAIAEYEQALALCNNMLEQRFLQQRLNSLKI